MVNLARPMSKPYTIWCVAFRELFSVLTSANASQYSTSKDKRPPTSSKVARALAEAILAYNMTRQSNPLVYSTNSTQLQYNRPCDGHFQLQKLEPPFPAPKTPMLKEVGFTHAGLSFRERKKTHHTLQALRHLSSQDVSKVLKTCRP